MFKKNIILLILLSTQASMASLKKLDINQSDSLIKFSLNSKGLNGEYIVFHLNGQVAVKGCFKNGKRSGEWKSWYNNGQIFYQRYFISGHENGISTYWYKNGKINIQGNYEKGWKTKNWKIFDSTGLIRAEGSFERNVHNGIWRFYSQVDTLQLVYKYGKLISKYNYYQSLVLSAVSITFDINMHERFIWRFNSECDYLLELDKDENKLLSGMYSFSNYFNYPNFEKNVFYGEISLASFNKNIKIGVQESYYYSVSNNETINTKWFKFKSHGRYRKWDRPFNNHSIFKYEDLAILKGINSNGKFKGTYIYGNSKRSQKKIDEEKDSVTLADNFYEANYTDSVSYFLSILANDSICQITYKYNMVEYDTLYTEWDIRDNKGHKNLCVYKEPNSIFKFSERSHDFNKLNHNIKTYTCIIDPAYKYPILYYDKSSIGYKHYHGLYIFNSKLFYPYNLKLHGNYTEIDYYKNKITSYIYDYGLLIYFNEEQIN
jgi:hypothetical protein